MYSNLFIFVLFKFTKIIWIKRIEVNTTDAEYFCAQRKHLYFQNNTDGIAHHSEAEKIVHNCLILINSKAYVINATNEDFVN